MDIDKIVNYGKEILEKAEETSNDLSIDQALLEAKDYLRVYAGENSQIFLSISQIRRSYYDNENAAKEIIGHIKAFVNLLEHGTIGSIPIRQQARNDVISDFLSQAIMLLSMDDVHPGVCAVIIGSVLEEFLRIWVEEKHLDITGQKLSIETYKQALRKAELIEKQDDKNITVWAGLRNDAAHGHWDRVGDRNQIRIMLDGVNLFLQQYSSS